MEKHFSVNVYFSVPKRTAFGVDTHESMALLISEANKERLLEDFNEQENVMAVNLGDGTVRYVNTKNILFIDVSEVVSRAENLAVLDAVKKGEQSDANKEDA